MHIHNDIKKSHFLLCRGSQTQRSSNVWFTLYEAVEHAKLNHGNRNHQGVVLWWEGGSGKGPGKHF